MVTRGRLKDLRSAPPATGALPAASGGGRGRRGGLISTQPAAAWRPCGHDEAAPRHTRAPEAGSEAHLAPLPRLGAAWPRAQPGQRTCSALRLLRLRRLLVGKQWLLHLPGSRVGEQWVLGAGVGTKAECQGVGTELSVGPVRRPSALTRRARRLGRTQRSPLCCKESQVCLLAAVLVALKRRGVHACTHQCGRAAVQPALRRQPRRWRIQHPNCACDNQHESKRIGGCQWQPHIRSTGRGSAGGPI